MAANFESGVTYGEKSWHGGEENRAADDRRRFSVEETIAAGLDWTTVKLPLVVAPDAGDLAGTSAEGVFGVFRTDRWECLGGVGADYVPLQNREIFAQFQPFLDARALSFESCGSLDGGRRVYVQAKLCQEDVDIGGGDLIRPYLLIASSHDGSLATHVGFTPQRVVCWNTLSAAVSRGGLLRVRHTRGQHAALDAVMESVNLARQQFEATCEVYGRLQRAPISKADLGAYVKRILDIPADASESDVSSRKRNQWAEIVRLARYGRGQSSGELTAWAAYNGVTEWTSHHRQKSAESRQKSVWFGASNVTNRRALELAVELASAA